MTRARNSANLASHGNLFVDIANDRTGIGSVVPDQNLHVAGTAGFHADVTFTGDLYNTTWDRSANSLKFNDNALLRFGTGNDANIRHDGSNTWIQNTTGYLYIDGNGDGIRLISHAHWQAGAMAAFYKDGGVVLYHDASNKFSTEAYGTNTTGTAVNDGLVVAGVATVTTMNVTGVLTYDDVTSVDSVGIVTARQGVRVTADGSNTANYISVGAGDDFRLFHDGSNTFLKNNTGDLYLKSSSNDYIKGVSSTGSVELKYGGTTKFSTQNHGATLQGNLNINGTVNANVRLQSGPNTVYASVTFFNAAGSASNSINSYAASILFITGRDATVFSDSSAEICEIVSSGIHPRTASTACALGTSSKRWDNVYADAADIAGNLTITDSIVHSGDTNTKIRFPSADTVTAETDGTERLRITSTGKIEVKGTRSGDLQASDDDTLQLYTKSTNNSINRGTGITFYNHDNSGYEMGGTIQVAKENGTADNVAAYMRFSTRPAGGSATERLRITSGGRVGINQASPEAMLQVDYDYANSEVGLRLRSASGSGTKTWQLSEINGNAGVFTIRNATNSQNILNIDGVNQRIGVNETSPSSVFHIKHTNNNTADITIEGGGTGNAGLQFIPGGQTNSYFAYVDTNRNFRMQDHTAERLRIIAGGKVLIGNGNFYTPQGMLHIVGDDNSNGPELYLQVGNNNTTDNIGALVFGNNVDKSVCMIRGSTHTANNTGDIEFHTSTTGSMSEKARITSAGSLGVGVNPEANSLIHVKKASGAKITIESDDNNDAWINYSGQSNEMSAGFDKSASQFFICNSDGIQSNRRVSVHTNGTVSILSGDLVMHSSGHIEIGNGGNATNPMFLNTSDPNTGIFFPGADRMAFTTGGAERLEFTAGTQVNIGTNGVLKAQINNSIGGHYFATQCDDNNTGFEIYSQHGSTSSRNSFAVFNNSTGSKHNNFYVRGDNQVFISTNKDSIGLVMDGTSSGTAYGETGATIDFRMLNEVNQFTGDPAARIASYLERGNNGFGLKFFARNTASTFYAACQISADYEFEPCLDNGMNLGSDDRTWNKAYVKNAYPDHGTEQVTSGSSFSSSSYYDTGFSRGSMGGLDTNGVYIITLFADTYAAGGGNYSCNYTWIVGMRNQSTNQNTGNSVPLLSVTGHSTNGVLFELRTKRYASVHGGDEVIQWRCTANLGEINNNGGRLMRWRVQRIGRSST